MTSNAPSDLNTAYLEQDLVAGGTTVGRVQLTYRVREVRDVRNLGYVRSYEIQCSQRVMIQGPYPGALPSSDATKYDGYPAALTMVMTPAGPGVVSLSDFSPKTLNTAISASTSNSAGQDSSFSTQHTTGSSISQTNSYDVSASVGLTGELPSIGGSATYGHSTTSTTDVSDSLGRSSGLNRQVTGGYSMSLKDWGSYGALGSDAISPGWLWAQEYPWNILAYNGSGAVTLPAYIQQRLLIGKQVAPPSELSLFGLDFTAHGRWLVQAGTPQAEDETLTVTHTGSYYTASHGLDASSFVSTMTPVGTFKVPGPALNLPLLALDVIREGGIANGAVTGFNGSQLLLAPAAGAPFRAKSTANNLYVTGTGFDPQTSADEPLTTTFPSGAAVVTAWFKIEDLADDLTLFIKHWSGTSGGCVMSVTINGSPTPVVRHVDAQELSSGSENVATIILRTADHKTGEYYDYLVPGLNKIVISVAPSKDLAATAAPSYALRALAVG